MFKRPKVSIFGAGNVGCALAQKITDRQLAEVVLWNRGTKSRGVALDLIQGGAQAIVGSSDYRETAHSDIVVITTGIPRQAGMSRDELLQVNAAIVAEVTEKAIAHSPEAILIVVTNPLDIMTYLAWEVSGLPSNRVLGISGTLDAARFKTFISSELGVARDNIEAMVVGSHSDSMIPLPRYCSIGGIPLPQLATVEMMHDIVERTRNAGGEIIQLMEKSAYYGPAQAIYDAIKTILLNQPKILPISAYLTQGEYGLFDIFLGTPCRMSSQGVEQVIELQLTEAELALLHQSAQRIRQSAHFCLNSLESHSHATELIAAAI